MGSAGRASGRELVGFPPARLHSGACGRQGRWLGEVGHLHRQVVEPDVLDDRSDTSITRTRKLAFERCGPSTSGPRCRRRRRACRSSCRRGTTADWARSSSCRRPRTAGRRPSRPRLLFCPTSARTWIPAMDDAVAGTPSPKSQNRWASLPASVQLRFVFVPVFASVAMPPPARRPASGSTRSRSRRRRLGGVRGGRAAVVAARGLAEASPRPGWCSRSASSGKRSGARSSRCRRRAVGRRGRRPGRDGGDGV